MEKKTLTIIIVAIISIVFIILLLINNPSLYEDDDLPYEHLLVDAYADKINATIFYYLLSDHIEQAYMPSEDELEFIVPIREETNESILKFTGFLVMYTLEEDNIVIRIKNNDKLYVLIQGQEINPYYIYFRINDINGTKGAGTYSVSINEEKPNIISYVYYQEGLYKYLIQ